MFLPFFCSRAATIQMLPWRVCHSGIWLPFCDQAPTGGTGASPRWSL